MLATTHTPVLARMHWEWVCYCYCCYRPLITTKCAKKRVFVGRLVQAPVESPYVFVCEHKHIWPKQTHAHSESTIFCTNPISGTIHGGLRGVVQAACDVCACKQAKPYRAMNITCTWAYLNIRCPSGVHLLRPSLCVGAVCDEKNISLTCKPGQVPRAAQAGLCCHLQLEAFP